MQVAERAITNDLEFLISKAVDPKKADYAVVAGKHTPPPPPMPSFGIT